MDKLVIKTNMSRHIGMLEVIGFKGIYTSKEEGLKNLKS